MQVYNILFGFNIETFQTPTQRQFNNKCKVYFNAFNEYANDGSGGGEYAEFKYLFSEIYNRSEEIPPVTAIASELQTWIDTRSPQNVSYSISNILYNLLYGNNQILGSDIKVFIHGDSTNVILSRLLNYLQNNPNYTEAGLLQTSVTYANELGGPFDSLGNIINPSSQQNTQAFTNYVKKSNNYSKISVDNGSSMWHSRLSGAPFSPKV